MHVSFLLVADCANITTDGKLNVMGIFTSIHAAVFPTQPLEFYLIYQLTAGPAEYERAFRMHLKLLDEDGRELMNVPVQQVMPRGDHGQHVYLNHILRVQKVVFERAGRHEIVVLVDNDQKASVAIDVLTANRPAGNSPV